MKSIPPYPTSWRSILTPYLPYDLSIKYPQFLVVLNTLNIQPHNTFLLTVWHCRLCSWAQDFTNCMIDSLVVHHWMVFPKTRPFVKTNKAEYTNVSSFTSLLMCSSHFTPSCRILLFSLPVTNNFFKFVYS
jgi:hypothetical protein